MVNLKKTKFNNIVNCYANTVKFFSESDVQHIKSIKFYPLGINSMEFYYNDDFIKTIQKFEEEGKNFSEEKYVKNQYGNNMLRRPKEYYLNNPTYINSYQNNILRHLKENDFNLLEKKAFETGALFSDEEFNAIRENVRKSSQYNEEKLIEYLVKIRILVNYYEKVNSNSNIGKSNLYIQKIKSTFPNLESDINNFHEKILQLSAPLLNGIKNHFGYDVSINSEFSSRSAVFNKLLFVTAKEKYYKEKEIEEQSKVLILKG